MTETVQAVHVVGIGGTLEGGSMNERAVRAVLTQAACLGATTTLLTGPDLDLPLYLPGVRDRTAQARRLVDELRRADAIVLGSPAYHGGVSGLIKNAIDYAEDLRDGEHRYFHGKPVACIATAAGWQGGATTLAALRSIVLALRGWPIPRDVLINSRDSAVANAAPKLPDDLVRSLKAAAAQLLGFVRANPVLKPQALPI